LSVEGPETAVDFGYPVLCGVVEKYEAIIPLGRKCRTPLKMLLICGCLANHRAKSNK